MNTNSPLDNRDFLFSVFTPTFNRRHTLKHVYESLVAQTLKDFEWLIIDDGSKDGTNTLVKTWITNSPFPIRYFWVENGGKHRAYNIAVRSARGHLFLALDSDDTCVPETLERFSDYWHSIPEAQRSSFSGVTVHCMDQNARIIGKAFPKAVLDTNLIHLLNSSGIKGEKWGIHRTEILKNFPFPEFQGEKFIPEGIVWNRIAGRYKLRFVNDALRVYHRSHEGLDRNSLRIRSSSPQGARLYYAELCQFPIKWPLLVKSVVNYIRFSMHGQISIRKTLGEATHRLLALVCLPGALIIYFADCFRLRYKRQVL